jgi:hypothetical protein
VGREQITLTAPVPHAGIHVNGLYQDRRRKASDEKNLKFRAARAPESLCKGKVIININREAYNEENNCALACLLLAPLAFAQPNPTNKKQATAEPITVTGTVIKMTTEEGAAANYVLKGPGHVVNKNGEVIQTAIKPGTRVRVYYVNMGDSRVVDHVVVE